MGFGGGGGGGALRDSINKLIEHNVAMTKAHKIDMQHMIAQNQELNKQWRENFNKIMENQFAESNKKLEESKAKVSEITNPSPTIDPTSSNSSNLSNYEDFKKRKQRKYQTKFSSLINTDNNLTKT